MTALFNRYLFNNRTIPGINGLTNTKAVKPVDMQASSTYVKLWSRGSSIGCEIYVCDSLTTHTSHYSAQSYTNPNILRCSLWNHTTSKLSFKLSSPYGFYLNNPEVTFKEFDDVINKMSLIIRDRI